MSIQKVIEKSNWFRKFNIFINKFYRYGLF